MWREPKRRKREREKGAKSEKKDRKIDEKEKKRERGSIYASRREISIFEDQFYFNSTEYRCGNTCSLPFLSSTLSIFIFFPYVSS